MPSYWSILCGVLMYSLTGTPSIEGAVKNELPYKAVHGAPHEAVNAHQQQQQQ